jgi:hypothetical protein
MRLPNVDASHDEIRWGWHVKLEGHPTDIGMQTFLSVLLHTRPDLKKLRLVFYIIEHDTVYPFYRNVHAIRRENPAISLIARTSSISGESNSSCGTTQLIPAITNECLSCGPDCDFS